MSENRINPMKARYNDEFIREGDWKKLDAVVARIMKARLNGVADLINAGLVADVSGWDTMVSTWNIVNNFDDAETSLDIVSGSSKDRTTYGVEGTVIPIIWKNYSLSARSSSGSIPTDSAISAADSVARKMEYILFNGDTSATSAFTCYGYLSHPSNQDVTVHDWSSATTNVIANIKLMYASMYDNGFEAPYVLYIPVSWYASLASDYHATHDGSFLQRIAEYGITVKTSSQLAAQTVLVKLDPSVVDLALTISPQTVIWQDYGNGLVKDMRVIAAMAPRLKTVGSASTSTLGVCVGTV